MCFSAQASFTTAAGLSVMGLLSLYAAKKNRTLLPLAASPLFFAVQQACEGIVWITLNAGDSTSLLHWIGVYGFTSFAALCWPIWIPLALYLPEKVHRRKKLLLITTYIGAFSAVLLFSSWVLQTTGAHVLNHHIDYPVDNYPFGITNVLLGRAITWIIDLAYCIAVIGSFFISSMHYTWLAGIVVMIAFATSSIFYYATFGSVWCFFAALSSALLYVVVKSYDRT
ncbi:MAG TPA: DUF6629 family protein [Candidatus Babeliales bacterium]|jgi:hypothetical protein|nr:DUF6629 family protein [Candidatus Babeliales bacterium]